MKKYFVTLVLMISLVFGSIYNVHAKEKPQKWTPKGAHQQLPLDWFGPWETPGRVKIRAVGQDRLPKVDKNYRNKDKGLRTFTKEDIPKSYLGKALPALVEQFKAEKSTKNARGRDIQTFVELRETSANKRFMLLNISAGFGSRQTWANYDYFMMDWVLLENGNEIWRHPAVQETGFSLSPWGHLLVSSEIGWMLYLDKRGKTLHKFPRGLEAEAYFDTKSGLMVFVDFSNHLSRGGRARVFDSNGEVVWEKDLKYHSDRVIFSPSGNIIGVGVTLFSRQGKALWNCPSQIFYVSADDRYAACRHSVGLVYDLQNGKLAFLTAEPPHQSTYGLYQKSVLRESADGRFLIWIEGGLLRVYDWSGNLYALQSIPEAVSTLFHMGDGTMLGHVKGGKPLELDLSNLTAFGPVETSGRRLERIKRWRDATEAPNVKEDRIKGELKRGEITQEQYNKAKRHADKMRAEARSRSREEWTPAHSDFQALGRGLQAVLDAIRPDGKYKLRRP